MSYTISNKTTDTPVTGVTSMSLPVKVTNFNADYRVSSRNSNELILKNVNSPISFPRSVRIGVKNVGNIFTNSPVLKTPDCPTTTGTQLLIGLNDTVVIEDAAVAKSYALPIRSHLVITVPNDPLVAADVVFSHIQRLLANLFEQGTVDSTRINALLHGILTPSVLDK